MRATSSRIIGALSGVLLLALPSFAALGDGRFVAGRYTADGSLDTSFDGDGKTTTDLSGSSRETIRAIAPTPDGKVVAVGCAIDSATGNQVWALVRYTASGAVDAGFGRKVMTGHVGCLAAAAIEPDGKLWVAGTIKPSWTGYKGRFGIARFDASGQQQFTVIQSFSSVYLFGESESNPTALLLQPDGKVVVGGSVTGSGAGPRGFAILRLNSNGSLDPKFGRHAYSRAMHELGISALALQPDSSIVAGGWVTGPFYGTELALARYGGVDGALEGGDIRAFSVPSLSAVDILNIALRPNGKIIAAGAGRSLSGLGATDRDFVIVARFTKNLRLDGSFKPWSTTPGMFTRPFSPTGSNWYVRDVAIDPNSKVVAAGWDSRFDFNNPSPLARFRRNGSRDVNFGLGGVKSVPFPHPLATAGFPWKGGFNAVALQPATKKIFVGGEVSAEFVR